MFYDWLSIEQDFGYQLPIIGNVAYQRIFIEIGEASALSQPSYKQEGSFQARFSVGSMFLFWLL